MLQFVSQRSKGNNYNTRDSWYCQELMDKQVLQTMMDAQSRPKVSKYGSLIQQTFRGKQIFTF